MPGCLPLPRVNAFRATTTPLAPSTLPIRSHRTAHTLVARSPTCTACLPAAIVKYVHTFHHNRKIINVSDTPKKTTKNMEPTWKSVQQLVPRLLRVRGSHNPSPPPRSQSRKASSIAQQWARWRRLEGTLRPAWKPLPLPSFPHESPTRTRHKKLSGSVRCHHRGRHRN